MIEAYAFLAMFSVQLAMMSVVFPAWLVRRLRRFAPGMATERYAQLHPGRDYHRDMERVSSRFRASCWIIGAAGIALLGWFVSYTQRPDWDDGPVEALLAAYFFLQTVPLLVVAWLQVQLKKKLLAQTSPEPKRKASLQRRGLFDFVSPYTLALAGACYVLGAAYVVYIAQDPFEGFAGIGVNIGMSTLMYAAQGFIVYHLLYGKKINGIETDAAGVHAVGLAVRLCVWVCIGASIHQAVNFTLVLQDLQRWEPFAECAFLVLCAMLCVYAVALPPRGTGPEGSGHDERLAQRKL